MGHLRQGNKDEMLEEQVKELSLVNQFIFEQHGHSVKRSVSFPRCSNFQASSEPQAQWEQIGESICHQRSFP